MSDNKLHHPFGASSMERRELCPASYRLEADLPVIESEYSAAGSEKHAQIAEAINAWLSNKRVDGYSEEIIAALDVFLDAYKSFGAVESVHIEESIELNYAGELLTRGTPDVVIVAADEVVIIDWKFGHRAVAAAADNPQGATYAVSAMRKYNKDKALVIFCNPVINQVTEHTFTEKLALLKYVVGVISSAKAENAPMIPGEKQCRYCKACLHGVCPAVNGMFNALVQSGEAPVIVENLTDKQLSELRDRWELVSKLGDRIDGEIKRRAELNGSCGDYYIKEVSGGREIADINAAYNAVGNYLDVNDVLGACSLSVAKLETAYAQKLKELDVVKTLKDGKAQFAVDLADLIAPKPGRKQLVKATATA